MPRKRSLTFDPEVFLQRIGKRKSTREYKNREAIFSQGDVADAMFYVEAGDVKLTILSKRGKKAVIAIFRAGRFFRGRLFRSIFSADVQCHGGTPGHHHASGEGHHCPHHPR